MSAAHSNLQAQVASVLGELVKVATVELTKLFETRYRACVHAERADGRSEEQEPEPAAGRGSRRSIGIQVNDSTDRADFAAPQCFWLASGDCLAKEEEEELPTPADSPTVDENEQVNLLWSLLQDVRGGEVNGSHGETGCVKTEAASHDQRPGPSEQSPATCSEQEGGISAGSPVLFVCPLFLKQESPPPEPESSEEPARAEPQHANVSTARGTAYSPSPLDGATAPLQAGAHERARAAKEAESHSQLQLKQTSPDDKLNRPCSVQLVNLLAASKPDAPKDAANCRAGVPTPKDLRCHQGPHTGHRLCCFTPCEDGVWRLHRVVTHTRGGYACDICGKRFKRRKILRRHERFHTGERPYSCSHCSKTFRLRKSARRHERFHTGERPHSCPQCGKCFRLRDNLKAHLRFHTGERPFICSICGKKYRIGKNLEKHNLGQCGFLVPSFRKIAGM